MIGMDGHILIFFSFFSLIQKMLRWRSSEFTILDVFTRLNHHKWRHVSDETWLTTLFLIVDVLSGASHLILKWRYRQRLKLYKTTFSRAWKTLVKWDLSFWDSKPFFFFFFLGEFEVTSAAFLIKCGSTKRWVSSRLWIIKPKADVYSWYSLRRWTIFVTSTFGLNHICRIVELSHLR